jgi:hypothetical protein
MASPLIPLVWADFVNGIYAFDGAPVPLADLMVQWPGYGDGLRVGAGLISSYGEGSPTSGSYPIAGPDTSGAMQGRSGANQAWSMQIIYNGLYSGASDDFPSFSQTLNHQRAFGLYPNLDLLSGGQQLLDGSTYVAQVDSFGQTAQGGWDGSAGLAISWDGENFAVAQDGSIQLLISPGENPLAGVSGAGAMLFNALTNPGGTSDNYYYDLYTISKFTFFNSSMELDDNPINGIIYASQFPVSSPYYNTASQTIVLAPGIPVVIPAVPCCALDAPCDCSLG